MNREIKFRAWDKKLNVMIAEGFHVIGEVTMFSLIDQHIYENKKEGEDMLERMGDVEIMQYTGLKDKNGKEIYEGDIMEYDTDDGMVIAQVVWKESDAEDMNISGFSFDVLHEREYNDDEDGGWLIIGNIYETPELLK